MSLPRGSVFWRLVHEAPFFEKKERPFCLIAQIPGNPNPQCLTSIRGTLQTDIVGGVSVPGYHLDTTKIYTTQFRPAHAESRVADMRKIDRNLTVVVSGSDRGELISELLVRSGGIRRDEFHRGDLVCHVYNTAEGEHAYLYVIVSNNIVNERYPVARVTCVAVRYPEQFARNDCPVEFVARKTTTGEEISLSAGAAHINTLDYKSEWFNGQLVPTDAVVSSPESTLRALEERIIGHLELSAVAVSMTA